jgi:hypothetical protein
MTVAAQQRKYLLKEVATWADNLVSIDVIIQQGENKGPSPDPPYLVISTVSMGVPVSTPQRRYVDNGNTNLDLEKTQHFRGEIQIDAIGEGADRELWVLGMLTDQNDTDVSISPHSLGQISDATQVFEGMQEHRATRDFEIRYKLTTTIDSGTQELQNVDLDIVDDNDNVEFDGNIDITT